MVSVHEEEKTLNGPKHAPTSNNEENNPISTKVRTILEVEHLGTPDVRTIEDALQQLDD